jgi:cell wall assembly regulator SMI1
MDIAEAWQRIGAWLRGNAPDISASLRPGASETDVKETEGSLSCALPASMASSYLIHDGMRGGVGPLIAGWRLLSLAEVVQEWQKWKQLSDEGVFEEMESDAAAQIRSDWWNVGWIPVGSNGSGDFACVDLDPPPTGAHGQIISLYHADASRELIAENFAAWLEVFVEDLESGNYAIEEEWLTRKA